MKFIADGMLGKLTRWLCMLGYNVKYLSKLNDAQLIMIAKKEGRILLTKDLELFRQAAAKRVNVFYLDGRTEVEKLSQLAQKFKIKLDINMKISRCPKCNTRVRSVPKERIADKVKKNTFLYYNKFWECSKCGQIYWQGAHWTRIKKTLERAKEHLIEKR